MTRSLLLVALLAGPALAQPSPPSPPGPLPEAEAVARARALYADGSRQYDLREYAKAIEAFRKAYDLYPQPLFLFNIGQAYRQLGDCDSARGFYRNYLVKIPAADNRDQVERFLAEMDRCVRAREEAGAHPASPPVAPSRGGGKLRLAGMITAGAGGVLAAIGVKFSLEASAKAGEIEDACEGGCDSAYVEDLDRAGRNAERNALVLYGVGGAAIAAGAGMLVYSALHRDRERITVTPTAGGAQVSARWSF
jgi:tetratricopeptide (TPR) repeat protein